MRRVDKIHNICIRQLYTTTTAAAIYGISRDTEMVRVRRGELQHLLSNPNVLIAFSIGIEAAKLCSGKILGFLIGASQQEEPEDYVTA